MVVTLASKSPKGLEQLQVMLMMCIESLQTDHVCVIILVGKKPLAGETPVFKGLNWSYGLSWHENVSIFGGFCLGWLVTSCPIHRGSEITPYFLTHPWIDFKGTGLWRRKLFQVSGERAASVSNGPSVEVKLALNSRWIWVKPGGWNGFIVEPFRWLDQLDPTQSLRFSGYIRLVGPQFTYDLGLRIKNTHLTKRLETNNVGTFYNTKTHLQ